MHIHLRHLRYPWSSSQYLSNLKFLLCSVNPHSLWEDSGCPGMISSLKTQRIKAYAQKCTLQHIQTNLWTVFLEENSIGDCYSGYILGAKPPKLAVLNQVKSWSKPTCKLNQTTKPRQEFLTIIQRFKPQTGTFTLLWPLFSAGKHRSPQPCSSYSLDQTIFRKTHWCPVPHM